LFWFVVVIVFVVDDADDDDDNNDDDGDGDDGDTGCILMTGIFEYIVVRIFLLSVLFLSSYPWYFYYSL
jgi:hypothetical protein